jgi:2-polyprenyl-6-methoxyphenol hydroxylase-like FAD-dependent oxidoreductase
MARVIVVGGGVVGMCASLLLAGDGHDVTVLERDPAPPPDPRQAWEAWERRGVNQFRLLHFFAPRFRDIVEANLPDVAAAFDAAGALRSNPLRDAPAEFTGGYRESDAKYETLTARRPVAEAAVASVVAKNDHIDMRRGVAVSGLLTAETHNGIPNVVGVRTDDGEELSADIVVDCAGRRSTLPKWLTEIGAPAPEEKIADCGFVYYGRHFKSADGSLPFAFGPLLQDYGTISTLTLPADNGTWGLGITVSANDKPMRRLKDVEVWERVFRSFPLVAHWLEGEPLDENVLVMAKIEDRKRSFVIGDQPLATGVLALADSWACTNPSLGRGISIGMIHSLALRDLLRDPPDDPVAVARTWDTVTTETVEPYVNGTMNYDESRLAEVDAQINGVDYEPNEEYELTRSLIAAGGKDPEMLRAFIDLATVMAAPSEVLGRPEVRERAKELGGNWRDEPLPGLSREELLAVVG